MHVLQLGAQNHRARGLPAYAAPLNSPPPIFGTVKFRAAGTFAAVEAGGALGVGLTLTGGGVVTAVVTAAAAAGAADVGAADVGAADVGAVDEATVPSTAGVPALEFAPQAVTASPAAAKRVSAQRRNCICEVYEAASESGCRWAAAAGGS